MKDSKIDSLRTMADECEKKGDREHDLGQVPRANVYWDEAARLRKEADEIAEALMLAEKWSKGLARALNGLAGEIGGAK